VQAWLVGWQGAGLRAQIVRRGSQAWVWTGEGALLGARCPELLALAQPWPEGTVVDGEIVAWDAGHHRPLPLAQLQARLARKRVTPLLLAQVPLRFVANDLLEHAGEDLRPRPLWQRHQRLQVLAGEALSWAPRVDAPDWPALATRREAARSAGWAGLLLRPREAGHGEGVRCLWAPEALCAKAVLVYAEPGTSYSFAVWNRPPVDAQEAQAVVDAIARREAPAPGALQLVAFAKVAANALVADSSALDEVVRRTTLQKFGPVRSLRPTLVVELGMESVARSTRHKSGLAVRGARLLSLCGDLPLHRAGTLQGLLGWLPPGE
jgi:DNA ligase-1